MSDRIDFRDESARDVRISTDMVTPDDIAVTPATESEKQMTLPIEPWWTVDELLEHVPLSVSWVYKLVESHRIPHVRRGRRIYFRRSEIDAWLEAGRG